MELVTLVLLAILIGIRHEMDAGHVTALVEMIRSEKPRSKQYLLGIIYAIGHVLLILVNTLLVSLTKRRVIRRSLWCY